jgi:phage terminase small subunit
MDGLNSQQKRFVEEYLVSLNATDAYRKAGYKAHGFNVAEVNASRLLRNAKVAAVINAAKIERSKRNEISADRVLQEAACLAFLDIRQLYDDQGNLLPLSQWPDDVAAAVAGIESVQQYEYIDGEKVPAGVLKKIRLWDKPGQLTLLAKHLRLLNEQPANTVVNVQVNIKTTLSEAFQRAYGTTGVDANGSGAHRGLEGPH